MSDIRKHRLDLIRDDNPEYYNICNLHNNLMDVWNKLNDDFHKWKQPKIFLHFEKEKIRSYYEPFKDLQNQYIEWNRLATNFLNKPKLIFDRKVNKDIGFIHFTNRLNDTKNHLSSNMILITNNFMKIQERYKSKVNFRIAILSATISSIGLWIALWSLFQQHGQHADKNYYCGQRKYKYG